MKTQALLAASAMAAAVSLAAGSASAQNIVINPGFESGNFSGWSNVGGSVQSCGPCVHSGDFGAVFSGDPGTLGQSLATMAGSTYTVSFWLNTLGEIPASVTLTWDGQVIFTQAQSGGDGWTQHTFTETAGSESTLLGFNFQNGAVALDDFSVSQAVPEPATWAIMLTGFLGAGVALRRRRLALAV